jgi:hypothetical protein
VVEVGGQSLGFQSLLTGDYASHQPLMFIRHRIGIVNIPAAGIVPLAVHPKDSTGELFWLRRVIVEPVN